MRAPIALLLLAAPLALAQTSHGRASTAAPTDTSVERPGDKSMTCDQIKAELDSITTDPAFQKMMGQQQQLAALGADAVAQHPEATRGISPEALGNLGAGTTSGAPPAQGENAPGAAATTPTEQPEKGHKGHGLFKAIGGGALGGFGGGRAASAAQERQVAEMGRQGRAAQEAEKPLLDAQAAQVTGLTPQLQRGMYLMQLGQAKGCSAEPPKGQ